MNQTGGRVPPPSPAPDNLVGFPIAFDRRVATSTSSGPPKVVPPRSGQTCCNGVVGIETEAHQEEEPPAPDRLPADLIGPVVGGLRSNDHIADATTVPLLDPSGCDAFLEDLDETAWQRMRVWQSPVQDSGAPAPSRGVTDEKVRRGLR